jgi:hypothetical protein
MERELAAMHRLVNSLYDQQKQLEAVLEALPAGDRSTRPSSATPRPCSRS